MITCIILQAPGSKRMNEKKTLYDLEVDEAHLITQEMILYTVVSQIEHKSTGNGDIVIKPLALEL